MALPAAPAVALSEYEFRLLRDLIEERFGVLFADDTAFLLERRLLPRLQALGLASYLAYYEYLLNEELPARQRNAELDELFERIATRETYFFRETYQLDAFREAGLPLLAERRKRLRALSIWCAGCASGEEVYTIAIHILESGLFDGWKVSVLGSDLSQNALATARAGVYGASSFRQADERLLGRYLKATKETGRYTVTEEVRRLTTFTRLNLCSSDWTAAPGPFDVIFCRNVLIYFDRRRRRAVLADFAKKLYAGGYLLLGHSESLLDQNTPFEPCHFGRELVYKKSPP